jgi:XTP/dITP diphosphohydrolase
MPSPAERTVLLATRSADKALEIRSILGDRLGRIITLHEAGIAQDAAEDDIEVHHTFLENAHAKADFFLRLTGMPTLADDSGICVHALGNAPGVFSRRYATGPGPDAHSHDQDEANNQRLLDELGSTPAPARTAHYTCAAVLHPPRDRRFAAIGVFHGTILAEPRGHHGFGYDPLFLDPATGLSFGQTEPAHKNARSHRARAFRALATL